MYVKFNMSPYLLFVSGKNCRIGVNFIIYPHTTNSHGRCCPWLRTVFWGSFSVKKRVLPPHSCQVLALRGYFDCWGCVSDIVGSCLTLKKRVLCCEN